ncbi:MAG: TDP-N-acetylfucosamine:lipid II N-acetylfucosaminyltransferase, partial [Bacteroidota bacterium]
MSSVHIFIHSNGVFIKKTFEYVQEIESNKQYFFIENGISKEVPKDFLITSKESLETLIENGVITKVIFHSLNYFQFHWLISLKNKFPKVQILWMFWSFEYYQLSFNINSLYVGFSKKYLLRKRAFNFLDNLINFFKKKSITFFPISEKKYKSIVNKIDCFCSLNEVDYNFIFGEKSNVNYHFMPYLDSSDLHIQENSTINKNRVMVGHNGSPLLNHYEVLAYLNRISLTDEIIIPLNYGKKAYINSLKAEFHKFQNLKIQLLENPLPLNDYYNYISDVEFFVLNSYCQQGLGNIIYFLFNYSTVYLSEKSSSFQFFKNLGFVIRSTEELLNGGELIKISSEDKEKNHELILLHFN